MQLAIQYLGFRTTDDRREYRLRAREGATARDYTVAIFHAAFGTGRVRLQDGPEICYLKVQRELAAAGLEGPTEFTVSDEELAAYRESHGPSPARRRTPKPAPVEPGEQGGPS